MDSDNLADFYHDKFKAQDYAEDYYHEVDGEMKFFMTEYFKYISKELTKKDSSHQLLDFGCGPVPIYAGIPSAASFPTTITMSDLVENNRDMITRFMNATDTDKLWEPHFKYMEKTFSDKRSTDIVRDLRASFKEVVYGNLHNTIPIPGKENYFDVIMTNMCLEFASIDVNHMKKDIKNLSNILKPGGVLIVGGALGIKLYSVKGENFPGVFLTRDTIKEMFKDPDMGMQLLVLKKGNVECTGGEDTSHDGVYFLVAQKMVPKKDLIEGLVEEHELCLYMK